MCLSFAKLVTSEEDIITYKVFEDVEGNLYSPMYYYKWSRSTMKKECAGPPRNLLDIETTFGHGEIIYGGAFHSFKYRRDAEAYLDYLVHNQLWNKKLVIKKCVIPKDSKRIFAGIFTDGGDALCYASTELILLPNEF